MMRIAVIDCGTNTFHLIIAEVYKNKPFNIVFKKTIPVKLGEEGISKKYISQKPFQRGMAALSKFSNDIKTYKAEKIFAFGTAALRNAVNGKEFIRDAASKTGITIKLISGKKEAELIYYGVSNAVNLANEKVLIMDIGGGSVEFIICNKSRIFWKHSFKIGAALLLEKFSPSDPIHKKEIQLIEKYLAKSLKILFRQVEVLSFQVQTLIGSSGSFDSFAEMLLFHFHYSDLLKNHSELVLNPKEYKIIHNILLNSTKNERKKTRGIPAVRVDMIVLASILLTFVLKKTGIKKMMWSDYALKEGILYSVVKHIR
ncbi:MAG: phosphatase [Bacteroidia bacterium]